jgi:hypothetical protein
MSFVVVRILRVQVLRGCRRTGRCKEQNHDYGTSRWTFRKRCTGWSIRGRVREVYSWESSRVNSGRVLEHSARPIRFPRSLSYPLSTASFAIPVSCVLRTSTISYHIELLQQLSRIHASVNMQPMPNRMGLGLRPPMPSFGQGPSMQALAQQQHMQPPSFVPPQAQRATNLFIGSISAGISDTFLNQLLSVRDIIFFTRLCSMTDAGNRHAGISKRSSAL